MGAIPLRPGRQRSEGREAVSFSRRRLNTRLAFDTAAHLLKRRDAWVDRMAVIPRLATLVGAKDAGRSPVTGFTTERIIWATQLERFNRESREAAEVG